MAYFNNYPNAQNYGARPMNYPLPDYYQQQFQNTVSAQQPLTNKIYVVSQEDALSRFSNPNTVTAYFLQDESGIVEVTTDTMGKKNAVLRQFIKPKDEQKPVVVDYITRDEFDDFRAKLEKAMAAISPKTKKKSEVIEDGE